MLPVNHRLTTLFLPGFGWGNRYSLIQARGVGLHKEPETHELILDRRIQRLAWTGAMILTLAVFTFYVRTLGKQSLWFDEGLSIFFAGRPLPQLVHTLIYEDLHPPLYYLVLHFWMILAGNSEWAVRLPSTFAATLMVPLTFAVVREVWSQEKGLALSIADRTTEAQAIVGMAAAALVGASPFIAFYAQETRMYSLAAALALATIWAFLRATRTAALRWWLAFSGLLAVSLYTQYLSAFIVPAFWLYTLLLDRKPLLRTILCTLLAALLYLPWIGPAYLQLGRLIRTPDYWVTTRINPGLFLRAMWSTFLPTATMRWGLLIAILSILLLIRFAWLSGFKLSERGRRSTLVFLTFAIPFILTYGVVTLAPKFATRYAIVSAAPLYICMALALYALLRHGSVLTHMLFGLLIIVALAISLHSAVAVVEGHQNQRDDARGLAAYLTENAQANDVLLLVENAPYALQYYYQGPAPWYGLHVGQDFSQGAHILSTVLETRPRRVWLILWHHEFADPTDMVVTELMRVGREIDIGKQFFGYQLRAFDILDYDQPIVAHPRPETVTDADFAAGLRLLGFDRLTHDGGRLHYVLYWLAQKPLEHNYNVTLSFQDKDGNEYLRQDQALSTPYFLPPVWPLDTPVRGRVDVALPADLPPLTYRVYLKVLDLESKRNLDLIDEHGIPLGQALLLEELPLSKSALGNTLTEVKNLLQADIGDGLQLLGFDLTGTTYSQGDTLRLTLWWQTVSKPSADHLARFRLLDGKNLVVWEGEKLILPGYPPTHWQSGEINRAIYRLTIPTDLASGEYHFQAGTEDRVISLTLLHVASREHRYDIPPMQQSLDVQFEQGITLLGYDWQALGLEGLNLKAPAVHSEKAITVTLYWQAKQHISTSYKVSVQMLSADLRIIAQDDSTPVHWTYPTTAWLPGEIITDEHVLTIRPEVASGSYMLIAVLYDERSTQRLRVEQGGQSRDHVILTILHIAP